MSTKCARNSQKKERGRTLIDEVGDATSGSVLLPLTASASAPVACGSADKSMWSVMRICST